MIFPTFKSIISKFADSPEDIEFQGGKILLQMGNEIIEFEAEMREGSVYIKEEEKEMTA